MAMPRVVLMGLLLLAGPSSMAEAAPQLWGIAGCQEGEVLPSTALPSTEALPCELAHLWVWDAHRALRKVPEDEAGHLLKREVSERGPRDSLLDLQVLGAFPPKEEGKKEAYEVIAAPVEAWLEIPEGYLPRWPVNAEGLARIPLPGEGLRIRVTGPGYGSWWRQVAAGQRTTKISVFPAEDRRIDLVGPEGGGLPGTLARMVSKASQRTAEPELARLLSDRDGGLSLVSVPDAASVFFEISDAEFAPTVRFGLPSSLPSPMRLERGAQLEGRVLKRQGAPIANARISFEAWIDPRVPRIFSRQTVSSDNGAWSLKGLTEGTGVLEITAEGYAAYREEISIDALEIPLGDQVLSLPGVLAVQVKGAAQEPVEEALILENGRALGHTDKEGIAFLQDRSSERDLSLRVTKSGYVPHEVSLVAPLPREHMVILERSAEIRGCLALGDERPVEAAIEVRTGAKTSKARSDGSGCFSLEVGGEEEIELHIQPRQGATVVLAVTAPAAGQRLDLGQITVDGGFSVQGFALREADSSPVSGARVWVVRSGARGPIIAWMMGHLMETETDQDGRFELYGFDGGEVVVHLEASGLARMSKTVRPSPPGEGSPEDLTLFLAEGGSLKVTLEGEALGEEVLLVDLNEQGLPESFVQSWFEGGVARVDHLPRGRHRYQVKRGEERLCEGDIAVSESDVELEVRCAENDLMILGHAFLGDRPAAGGQLRWMRGESLHPEAIMNHVGMSGLRQSRTFSWGTEQIVVPLDEEGAFESTRLHAGSWRVYWEKAGQRSEGLTRELVENSEAPLVLRFAGGLLRGTVATSEGEAVPRARIRDRNNKIAVITDSEGEFVVPGVSAGRHALQATKGELESEWVEIDLLAGEEPSPVTLTLNKAKKNTVEIAVFSQDGEPVRQGFIFFEMPGSGLRVRSLNAIGQAQLPLPHPLPKQLRVAAFSGGDWFLGTWKAFGPEEENLELRLGPTGTLQVHGSLSSGRLAVSAPGGWDMSRLLARLGRAPVLVDRGWTLTGLPRGRYRVEMGASVGEADVRPGSVEHLELTDP